MALGSAHSLNQRPRRKHGKQELRSDGRGSRGLATVLLAVYIRAWAPPSRVCVSVCPSGKRDTHLHSAGLTGGFHHTLAKSLRTRGIQQGPSVLTVTAPGPWGPEKVGEVGDLHLGPTPWAAVSALGLGFCNGSSLLFPVRGRARSTTDTV